MLRSLQRTLNELKEYQKQHDHYLRQQEILEKHKLIQEEQILRNIIHETQMAKEAQLGKCWLQAIEDRLGAVLVCFLYFHTSNSRKAV